MTCAIPMLYMEFVDRKAETLAKCFMIRTFMLIWGTIVFSSFYTEFIVQTTEESGLEHWDQDIARNVAGTAVALLLLGLFHAGDIVIEQRTKAKLRREKIKLVNVVNEKDSESKSSDSQIKSRDDQPGLKR